MRVGNLGGFDDLFFRDVLHAKGDVVEHGVVEEDGLLRHHAHQSSQVADLVVADVVTVDADGAFVHFIETRQKVGHG